VKSVRFTHSWASSGPLVDDRGLAVGVCQLVSPTPDIRHQTSDIRRQSTHVHLVTDLFLAWPTLSVRCGSAIVCHLNIFCYTNEVVKRIELASTSWRMNARRQAALSG
jgi:hypothetical protein